MKIEYTIHVFVFCLILAFIGCSSESKTIVLKPKTLNFENVNLGESDQLSITMTNKTGKEITVSNIDLTGSPDFTIVSGGAVPLPMAKGEETTIEIYFEPTNSGTITGLLSVKHQDSDKEYTVEIIGNGVPVPRIDVPVRNYDFGIVVNNSLDTEDFIVENKGTSELNLSQISLVGPGVSTFSITAGDAVPVIIDPGYTHTITVQFAPLVDGKYSVELVIDHNGVNESESIKIAIDGEGITHAPEIQLSETSPWDFGTALLTYPKILDLEISSTGIHDLEVTAITFASGTEFSLDSVEDSNGNPLNLPTVVVVGDKITAKIKFLPTAVIAYNDTMTIAHDGINEPSMLDVSLSGSGKTPVTETINYTGAIVSWTVPAGVTTLVIEVWGAEGNYHTSSNTNPGLGARMKGTFTVSPGDTLKLLVGEHKTGGNGGGGGSFVCKSNNDPMIIAGGGGGSSQTTDSNDKHGNITTTGGTGAAGGGAGGTNGQGGSAGTSPWNAGSGGGLLTDGANGSSYGGKAFVNGGSGGVGHADGGFGGGGSGSAYVVGGGGGGYSGGGGGGNSSAGVGGGGASINNGTDQSNSPGVNTGHGKIVFLY